MKSYVESTLSPNERIVYAAKIHWAIYLKPAFVAMVGLFNSTLSFYIEDLALSEGFAGFSAIFLLVSAISLIDAILTRTTTEMVITNKRVVSKFGFIRRQTFEPQLSQTEGANLYQSLLGRLLGYGEIKVNGTGGSGAPVPFVDDPVTFRNVLAKSLT
jgi:uncharacterized membrane protein YdbT with pleckstrin-like domain